MLKPIALAVGVVSDLLRLLYTVWSHSSCVSSQRSESGGYGDGEDPDHYYHAPQQAGAYDPHVDLALGGLVVLELFA